MVKRISILGSTGSIGVQTLQIISAFPEKFTVRALAAGSNLTLLKEQILAFKPKVVSVKNPKDHVELQHFVTYHHLEIDIHTGDSGLNLIASDKQTDLIIIAIVGTAALQPTWRAIENHIPIGLASKEVLVAAGDIIMKKARENNVPILPIDSEHAAIKQCLAGINENPAEISKLILTASGGPFFNRPISEFESITREEALNHPKWNMGPKICIDSATMMNKGLEVIEAHHLFSIAYPHIEVVIHPQSIVHSLVEFTDGTLLGQMGLPDMRFPIQYVLTYPLKCHNNWPKISLTKIARLDFLPPDHTRFPLLEFAYACGKKGSTWPAIMNASNEAAVQLFLSGEIKFTQIAPLVMCTTKEFEHIPTPTLSDIIHIDAFIKKSLTHA